MQRLKSSSFHRRLTHRRLVSDLCQQALLLQTSHAAIPMRRYKRYLTRRILKKIPANLRDNPRELMRVAIMVLAMWGFVGLTIPNTAIAAPTFVADATNNPMAPGGTPFTVGYKASPVFADIDADGDFDAFIGDGLGQLHFFRNTGTTSVPSFVADAANNPMAPGGTYFDVGANASPAFVDIDGDGDLDLFIGEQLARIYFYRNTGTPSTPIFTPDATGNPIPGVVGYYGANGQPVFADIDNDGDFDALVGEGYGGVYLYTNSGSTTSPVFTTGTNLIAPYFQINYEVRPALMDVDNDGDLDMFIGTAKGTVKFYRNTGTASAPAFTPDAAGNLMAPGGVYFDVGQHASPTLADIDGDGDLDMFVGERYGPTSFFAPAGVRLYRNGDPTPTLVDDNLNATTSLAVTTGDVTANDIFTVDGPASSFTITAFDTVSIQSGTVVDNGNNTFTYTSAAGFTGSDSFTYTLDNGAGITAVGTVNVLVSSDTTPPVVTPPANITQEATAPLTPIVSLGTATVTDNVDTGLVATPNAIGPFTVGGHAVTWSATDSAGNTGTATQTVTITDTTAPVITLNGPATITIEAATGFIYRDAGASFSDAVGGTGRITGRTVDRSAPGTYTLTYNYIDAAGNAATPVVRTVIVQDTTAPSISAPPSIILTATSTYGINTPPIDVNTPWVGVYASDNVGLATLTHNASATLPIGTSTVTFTAIDAAGNSSTASSTVTVRPSSVLSSVCTFNTVINTPVGTSPVSFVSGDFNGDGNLDLAVANNTSGNVSILIGNGNGTFKPAVNYTVSPNPTSVISGDFNGDGNLDLAVADQAGNNINILMGSSTGIFNVSSISSPSPSGSLLARGDFNGDGILDLAVAPNTLLYIYVLTGDGSGNFTYATTTVLQAIPGANSLLSGDFNGDNITDLALTQPSTASTFSTQFIMTGNGDNTFNLRLRYSPGGRGRGLSALDSGDFNGDGNIDFVTSLPQSNLVFYIMSSGLTTGSAASISNSGWASRGLTGSPQAITTNDLDGDNNVDIAVAKGGSNSVAILAGNGDGTFQPAADCAAGQDPRAIISGDFNGDGSPDLATANYASGDISILLNNTTPLGTPAGGGGGCMIKPNAPFDPLFAIIVALMSALGLRRKKGGSQ